MNDFTVEIIAQNVSAEIVEPRTEIKVGAPQGQQGNKGDPGGNSMAIGLFSDAAGLTIPVGVDLVRTSGQTEVGMDPADFAFAPSIGPTYVSLNPNDAFITANGRAFKRVLTAGHRSIAGTAYEYRRHSTAREATLLRRVKLAEAEAAPVRGRPILGRYRKDGAGVAIGSVVSSPVRSGVATYPPLDLPITTYADGVPRLTAAGQVSERATINQLDSPTFAGAVAGVVGAGGALPTGWASTGGRLEVISVTTQQGAQVLRIRLFRDGTEGYNEPGPSIRMAGGVGLKSIPDPARGGMLLHAMVRLVSSSGIAGGIFLNNIERTPANVTVGNTQSTVIEVPTAGFVPLRAYRAGFIGNDASPRLAVSLDASNPLRASGAYERVVDIAIPQLEDASSIDDFTTFANTVRNVEEITVSPPSGYASFDRFVQGDASGQWAFGVATAANLPVPTPPLSSAVKDYVFTEAGSQENVDERAALVGATNPPTWGAPRGIFYGSGAGSPPTPLASIEFGGRLFGLQTANGQLFDGAKAYAAQQALNRNLLFRLEVRQGDFSWSDALSGASTVDRSGIVGGWYGNELTYNQTWQTQFSFFVEDGDALVDVPGFFCLLSQFHDRKDADDATVSPPASLQIRLVDGIEHLAVDLRTSAQNPVVAFPLAPGYVWTDRKPLQRGKWYHVVERVVFDWNGGGRYRLWFYDPLSGTHQLMTDYNGAVGYDQANAPYWDLLVYRRNNPSVLAVQYANPVPPVQVGVNDPLPLPSEIT